MEKLTLSPAPWHVSGSKIPIVYDANGWAVCNAVVFHGRHSEGQSLVNAKLIAAAPELLAALDQVDAYLSPFDGEEDAYAEIRSVIQQAIAKAKGE